MSNSIKVSDLMDLNLLNRAIQDRLINFYIHPDDPSLKILQYNRIVQVTGAWNEATKQCRGLIVRSNDPDFSDAVVVARPWRKFFTLQQIQSGWVLGDEEGESSVESELKALDFSAPAEVTDKLDGSLGILYRDPLTDEPALTTKGSFESEQAKYYTHQLRNNPKQLDAAKAMLDDGNTYLFEMVGCSNRVVLEYPKDDIVLIGSVTNCTGVYNSPNDPTPWRDAGLSLTETMSAKNLGEAVNMADRENKEGMVIRILNAGQQMIKIKQEDYFLLKYVENFGSKSIGNTLKDMTFTDLEKIAEHKSSMVHAGVRQFVDFSNNPMFDKVKKERRKKFDNVLIPLAQSALIAKKYIESIPESDYKTDPVAFKKSFSKKVDEIADKLGVHTVILYRFLSTRMKGEDLNTIPVDFMIRLLIHIVKDTRNQS